MFQRFIVYVNKGDHGYHNWEMDMKTIFWAFGPSFKKNFVSESFDSVHIYPLMCKLLQIQPAPHNGSLAVTKDMLQSNGESDQHRTRLPEGPVERWKQSCLMIIHHRCWRCTATK